MKALEFTAEVDTHHCLRLNLPETTAPGPVRVLVLLPEADETGPAASDDETEGVWMRGVAHEWRAELADEREDIYTLEDGSRSMRRGEIYLASFPFGDQPGMKVRPTLLLTAAVGTGTEVVAAYISSVLPSRLLASDLLLDPAQPEHRQTGLRVVSVLRLHKIATINTTSLRRDMGSISAQTQRFADGILRATLSL